MSKYDSRIDDLQRRVNELFVKINVFFSIKDLLLIQDYYRSLLNNRNVEPDDLQELYIQIDELAKECEQDKSIDYQQKFRELITDNNLIYIAFYYRFISKQCVEYPSGVWVPNNYAQSIKQNLLRAKDHFDKKGKN
jgi:hypothetical protein